jgi:hypothetical protein
MLAFAMDGDTKVLGNARLVEGAFTPRAGREIVARVPRLFTAEIETETSAEGYIGRTLSNLGKQNAVSRLCEDCADEVKGREKVEVVQV